jgi:hypothetical protein
VGTVTLPAVTVNAAEVAPWSTVTLDSMLAAVGDEVKAIVAPPLGAAAVRATVQDDAAGGAIVTGVHENPFKASGCWIVTVLPAAVVVSAVPAESADPAFANWSKADVSTLVFESVKDTVARTPSEIVEEPRPHTMHLGAPIR